MSIVTSDIYFCIDKTTLQIHRIFEHVPLVAEISAISPDHIVRMRWHEYYLKSTFIGQIEVSCLRENFFEDAVAAVDIRLDREKITFAHANGGCDRAGRIIVHRTFDFFYLDILKGWIELIFDDRFFIVCDLKAKKKFPPNHVKIETEYRMSERRMECFKHIFDFQRTTWKIRWDTDHEGYIGMMLVSMVVRHASSIGEKTKVKNQKKPLL